VWARVITDVTFDAVFSKSTDFGLSWSPAKVLIEHAHDGGAISGQILVAYRPPVLYHLTSWEEGGTPGPDAPAKILIQRSSDAGLTWSKPVTALDVRTLGYARSGARGSFVRTGVEVPDFAIDPSSGTLYAAWQDARFSGGYDEVAFSTSTDGGNTWSSPTKINQTAGDLAAIPAVAVGADGAVGIFYYSFHFGEGQSPPIDARVFLAVSRDGGRTFATKQLAGPVDARKAPQVLVRDGPSGQSYFLGDYAGLDAVGSEFAALFALPNPSSGDPADVFFSTGTKRFPRTSAIGAFGPSPPASSASAPVDVGAEAGLAIARPVMDEVERVWLQGEQDPDDHESVDGQPQGQVAGRG
jgi:hypothetical protein